MLGNFLDRLGAFVQANLKSCIAAAALVTAVAIFFNAQSSTRNSVWGHILTLGGLALGTFIMVMAGKSNAQSPEGASSADDDDAE